MSERSCTKCAQEKDPILEHDDDIFTLGAGADTQHYTACLCIGASLGLTAVPMPPVQVLREAVGGDTESGERTHAGGYKNCPV